ncbi:MAG TPA: NADP-dependent oxidoreductase [Lacunisphaera sp.]|nr:NADP-dependent oxidoreductase [Lacunisphaera sp.]
MQAMFLTRQAGPDALVWGDIAQPQPQAGEVLVRVHAAALTPPEFDWFPTFHRRTGEPRPFPIVPGHELSGVVAAVGEGVTAFRPGSEVYGLNDWFANGALADFTVAPVSALATKPVSLTHAQAAVVPISALTALQALFVRGGLRRGQRVLVHGATGGVGAFAVQLARWAGAEVVATASTGNLDFARELGAAEVIDYRRARFEKIVRGVDLVLDTVGGETLERSRGVLRASGRLVTVASSSSTSPDPRVRAEFMLVEANGIQLAEIGWLIDEGELYVPVAAEFPLRDAREAFAFAARGGKRGKVALAVAEVPAPAV